MARNPQRIDSGVINYPSIVDIEVQHQETFINFVKQSDPKHEQKSTKNESKSKKNKQRRNRAAEKEEEEEKEKEKEKEKEEKDEKEKEEKDQCGEPGDGERSENEMDEAAGPSDKKKPKALPKFLQCSAKYDFRLQTVILCFWDPDFDWSLVSLTGLYNFNNIPIREMDFQEFTGDDFIYNITPLGSEAKLFKLNVSKIDRHILMKKFTVDISYIFLSDIEKNLIRSKYWFDVPYFQKETRLQFKFLGHFHADRSITSLYNHKFKTHPGLSSGDLQLLNELDQYQRLDQRESLTARTISDSTKMIKYALNIEDLSSQDELKAFAMEDVKVYGLMNNYWFNIQRNKLPPNWEEMTLCLVPMNKYRKDQINFEDDCIFTQIESVKQHQIHFEKRFPILNRDHEPRYLNLDTNYFIRFIPNRITYRACFQALDTITQHLLRGFFDRFEDEPVNCGRENNLNITNFEWFNGQIATNEEQMTAIKNIVNCTAYPFPYVIYGPPGTGKTCCIVECIAQIVKLNPNSRIMVTAQSNSACDEVGVRLLKYISPKKIFRFYSPSLLNPENGETIAELRRTSNLRNKRNEYPSKEEFGHFNVVIVTLMSCSRLVQFNNEGMNRNFDYIFVDECAAATEPEAFVPIIGLGTDFQEITTNIVLLGDHKQLGPVISSDIASRLGLGVSLMERIMSKPRYRVNPIDNSYDSNYVTQLLDNYRSHPAILQFSNVLFYDSKLRAKLGEPEKSFGTRWNYLNNKRFPILFHCVKTSSKIMRGRTSSYNEGEIKMVRFYVDLLLRIGIDGETVVQEDIGVVSPYKAQLNMLRKELQHVRGVEIGTAEYYQGREKKIIIISTVKSRNHVGFLKSEKRLNVCITRAKSLLILIGNADTLQQNSLWNSFMHFCKANDGCCGENFELTQLTEEEQRIMDEVNNVFVELSINDQADAQPAIDRDEKLKAIEDRMKKLQELMRQM